MAKSSIKKSANGTYGSTTAKAASKKTTPPISSSDISETDQGGSLHKFFVEALQDIYWGERNLLPALQKLEDAATTTELKEAFEDHRYQTQKHASRLEKVFMCIEEKPKEKKCEAMEGLFKEASEIIKNTEEGSMTRDAGLIIAAQKVEHYEIATYGGLVALARTMEYEDAANLLEKTLEEEEQTDVYLTEIAETRINFQSVIEDVSQEDVDERGL